MKFCGRIEILITRIGIIKMSERGCFCTEFIENTNCLNAVINALRKQNFSITVEFCTCLERPIVCGYLKGTAYGDEFLYMEEEVIPAIQTELAKIDIVQNLRINVMNWNKSSTYKFNKDDIIEGKDFYNNNFLNLPIAIAAEDLNYGDILVFTENGDKVKRASLHKEIKE